MRKPGMIDPNAAPEPERWSVRQAVFVGCLCGALLWAAVFALVNGWLS